MGEQDRINAVISYFFLGPLFLLAKSGTPLADTYVQHHARRASKIIAITIAAIIGYFFLYRYIDVSVLGIHIPDIVLMLIMGICSIALIRGAYRAYQGDNTDRVTPISGFSDIIPFGDMSDSIEIQSDEEKMRIIVAMVPYIGIYITKKYDHPIMIEARLLGSAFMTFFIVVLLLGGDQGFLSFLMIAGYILLMVIEGVYMFLYGRWISWPIMKQIPSYNQAKAHIYAILHVVGQFLGVIFGREKGDTYSSYYQRGLTPVESSVPHIGGYFMPAGLIGIPLWNILTLPSLFLEKYRDFRMLIIQGLIITLCSLAIYFFGGNMTGALWFILLFPIAHIAVHAGTDTHTESPLVGTLVHILSEMKHLFSHHTTQNSTATFTYETTSEISSKQ